MTITTTMRTPTIAGITMKNTMMSPCAVTSTFHRCSAWSNVCSPPCSIAAQRGRYWMPGCISSARISPEIEPPMIPATIAKIRYSVPMSLWLVDMNQRAKKPGLWSACASWW